MFSTAACPFLSLFCSRGFREQGRQSFRPELTAPEPPIHHTHARQATSAHSVTGASARCTALQVHNLIRTQAEIPQGSTSVHKNRSPRKQGRGNHAIGNRPESASAITRFPPAPTRNWAYQASTRDFIDVPFRGFLGPPSETAVLTRILRRCSAWLSIALFQ